MRYQGKILNLNNFKGIINITTSTFKANRLYFNGGCNVLTGDGLNNKAESQYSPIYTNTDKL